MPPQGKKEEGKSSTKKKRSGKHATQRTPMQRVLIVGPTGKRRMEWRPWPVTDGVTK